MVAAAIGPGVEAPAPAPLFLRRDDFDRFVQALRVDGRQVVGPTVRDGAIMLDEIQDAGELPLGWGAHSEPGSSRLHKRADTRVFDQPPGPTSWKRWTFPPRVEQASWDTGRPAPTLHPQRPSESPLAFLGVRACEIAALQVQDRVLLGGSVVDVDYAQRRSDNLIVAVECAVASETCFCSSMGTGPEITGGYDIALSELADGFVMRVATPAGQQAVADLPVVPATPEQLAAAEASVARVREQLGAPLPMHDVPARLKDAAQSPAWEAIAERCLACTNCTLVCPTCFCTSVTQLSDLDGAEARTERKWDSCFSLEFARVAGGNFRTRVEDRYRQWLTHKFGTWWDQFGTSGCVGCGRCIAWCPVGIDVRESLAIVSAMGGPSVTAPPPAPPSPPPSARPSSPVHAPLPRVDRELPWVDAVVTGTAQETRDVATLRLHVEDERIPAGQPGQFVMVGLPAVGAPPISVSRFHPDGLELTVRAAGAATARICELKRGQSVALRGPLGRGWPVEQAEGRDVLIVTGGIGLAPLRPLLDALLQRRDRIGRLQLAYGARTPSDRLYTAELDRLAASGPIEIAQTVDRAGPDWLGRVGVVTQVIDRALCSCDRTVAFVCGPERMMEATATVLRERGVPDERIYVTLERRMECGVGLCGHCQLGGSFVCKDGPVFSLAELGPRFGIEGL